MNPALDVTSCETHRFDVTSLRDYLAGIKTVHPSDVDSPNVLDVMSAAGKLAERIYVRQRVAVLDGSFRVTCGELACCGGADDAESFELIDQARAELSIP